MSGRGVMSLVATSSKLEERQGRLIVSQLIAPTSSAPQRIHPRAVVPTPTYFSPEAVTTKVITGRM